MPFTGTPVIKQVADNLVRITGVSLAGGAGGTIGLAESTHSPDILLPASFKPRPYSDVTLQDSIEIEVIAVATGATAVPVAQVKSGETLDKFLAFFGMSRVARVSVLIQPTRLSVSRRTTDRACAFAMLRPMFEEPLVLCNPARWLCRPTPTSPLACRSTSRTTLPTRKSQPARASTCAPNIPHRSRTKEDSQ